MQFLDEGAMVQVSQKGWEIVCRLPGVFLNSHMSCAASSHVLLSHLNLVTYTHSKMSDERGSQLLSLRMEEEVCLPILALYALSQVEVFTVFHLSFWILFIYS